MERGFASQGYVVGSCPCLGGGEANIVYFHSETFGEMINFEYVSSGLKPPTNCLIVALIIFLFKLLLVLVVVHVDVDFNVIVDLVFDLPLTSC